MPLSSRGKSGTVGDFLFFYVPANTFIFDSGVLRASYRALFPVGLNRLHSQFGVDRQFVFTLMKETLPSSRNPKWTFGILFKCRATGVFLFACLYLTCQLFLWAAG